MALSCNDLVKIKKDILLIWHKDPVILDIAQKYHFEMDYKKPDVYYSLIQSIISQQLSVKVAAVIAKRFLSLFEDQYPHPEIILSTNIEDLRTIGLSYQKANYIRNIASHFTENQLLQKDWKELEDEEIINELCKIKGVGLWTSQMVLMFSLYRMDVFPIGDLAIRNAMILHYNLDNTVRDRLYQQLTEIADNWRPYRSIACHYLWASINPK